MMKKVLLICLPLLLGSPLMGAAQSPGMPPINLSNDDLAMLDEMFKNITEDDIKQAMQELERMSPEERAELDKFVDGILSGEEASPPPAPESHRPAAAPMPAPEAVKPQTITPPPLPKQKAQDIKTMLESIAHKLAEVRQKSAMDKSIKESLEPWRYHIDDVIYFAHILVKDHLIKFLAEKEFEPLLKALEKLNEQLVYFEPKITPREFSLAGETPYHVLGLPAHASYNDVVKTYNEILNTKGNVRRQLVKEGKSPAEIDALVGDAEKEVKAATDAYSTIMNHEQSRQALQELLRHLSIAINQERIGDQVKQVLQKYDPEALTLRQEQEKKEEQARKQQEEALRRLPSYVPMTFEPLPRYNGRKYEPAHIPGYGDYTPSGAAGNGANRGKPESGAGKDTAKPGAGKPGAKPSKPKDKKKDKSKDKAESDARKTAKPTEQDTKKQKELEMDVELELRKLDDDLKRAAPGSKLPAKDLLDGKTFKEYLSKASDDSNTDSAIEGALKAADAAWGSIIKKLEKAKKLPGESQNALKQAVKTKIEKKKILSDLRKLEYYKDAKGSHILEGIKEIPVHPAKKIRFVVGDTPTPTAGRPVVGEPGTSAPRGTGKPVEKPKAYLKEFLEKNKRLKKMLKVKPQIPNPAQAPRPAAQHPTTVPAPPPAPTTGAPAPETTDGASPAA